MSPAETIPPHVVHQVLYHLLPPTPPLPEHLIARDLLQRHHFLDINPDNVESYFCWPSSNPSDIIRELELLAGNVDILERASHEIVYEEDLGSISSEDDEPSSAQFRARVRIADDQDLWMLFVWQGADEAGSRGEAGWRYFDTKRILPSDTRARATSSALESSPELDASTSMSPAEVSRPTSPSSDAYWDNYGGFASLHVRPPIVSSSLMTIFLLPGIGSSSSQNSPSHMSRPIASSKEEDDEAAYWATYASVQGTADSTIPSPPSRKTPMLPNSYRGAGPGEEMERGINAGYYRTEYEHNRPEEYPYGYESGDADFRGGDGGFGEASYGLGLNPGFNPQDHEGVARVLRAFIPDNVSDGDAHSDDSAIHARKLATALFPVLSLQEYRERESQPQSDASAERAAEAVDESSTALKPLIPTQPLSAVSLPIESTAAVRYQKPGDEEGSGVTEAIQGIYKMWISQQPNGISPSDAHSHFLDIVSRSVSAL